MPVDKELLDQIALKLVATLFEPFDVALEMRLLHLYGGELITYNLQRLGNLFRRGCRDHKIRVAQGALLSVRINFEETNRAQACTLLIPFT